MPKLTFFIHAHKAAGTSMIHFFGQDESFVLCNGWEGNGGMPPLFREFKQIETNEQRDAACSRERMTRLFGRLDARGINFVATEWLVPFAEDLPRGPDYFYFTVLRDPYARYVSNFRFDRKRGYRRVPSIYDFRDDSIFRTYNYYTRLFSSRHNKDDSPVTEADYERAVAFLRQLDAVIILEEPKTLDLLAPLGVDVSKFGRRNTTDPENDDVPADFKDYFRERAKWDYLLYEQAKQFASVP